jgi:hypothetical protein
LYQIERNPDVRAHAYGVSEILVLSPRDAEQLKDGLQIDTVRLAQLDLTWKADFRPVAGQPNTWVIHLPAELLRRAEASRFAYGLRPVPEGMTLARIIPDTGGSLPPGTRVDVSVTYLLPDTGEPDAQTRTLLTNVELFAPAVRDGRSALIETDLALLVTPEQAAAVDAARSHAWFRLSESAEQSTAVTGELPDPGLMEELNRAQPPERRSRFRGTGPAFQ